MDSNENVAAFDDVPDEEDLDILNADSLLLRLKAKLRFYSKNNFIFQHADFCWTKRYKYLWIHLFGYSFGWSRSCGFDFRHF